MMYGKSVSFERRLSDWNVPLASESVSTSFQKAGFSMRSGSVSAAWEVVDTTRSASVSINLVFTTEIIVAKRTFTRCDESRGRCAMFD